MKKNKATAALELLNSTNKTDHQIAYAVGCHVTYVKSLRRKMAHKAEEPETEEAVEKDGVDAILTERGGTYGPFKSHAEITQRLKRTAYEFAKERDKSFALDQAEALDMIFHKIGRILNGDPNYADSWIDIAGYAKLVADRLKGKSK